MAKKMEQDYLRSIIFGVEDALVSTTGVVVGISAGSSDRSFVILAGIVLVAVEAVSMSAGQYLSEETVHEMTSRKRKDSVFVSALLMFLSYGLAGSLPVLPFFFLDTRNSAILSVLLAFVGLYVLGYLKGKYLGVPSKRSGMKMVIVGGAATLLGVIVGYFLKV